MINLKLFLTSLLYLFLMYQVDQVYERMWKTQPRWIEVFLGFTVPIAVITAIVTAFLTIWTV